MGRAITVDARAIVAVEDALECITTEELRGALQARYEPIPDDLHDALRGAAPRDVPTIIERFSRPKWKNVEACAIDYHFAMMG